jgi:predicted amidophosphoribosyltransferase
MITIYCRGHHGTRRGLCPECQELLDYAIARLDRCPFQTGKTTCADCSVHCYRPAEREMIRAVMRYAGPRMLFRHPILTLFHFIDSLRKEPVRPGRADGDP